MESHRKYDFAIFGEGSRRGSGPSPRSQGDRVLVIPERKVRREFVGRILFGLEANGILLQMLERWESSRPVPGSVPRIVRLMLHYYADDEHIPRHVYLGAARALRSDLDAAQ